MKQNPKTEIFSQGDEVIIGEIADTNAAWLSGELSSMGFDVVRHTAVGDRLEALIELLKEISARSELCICTGGLGPTSDDLTAEAVAEAFQLPLEFDADAFEQIKAFFQRFGRPMPEINRKQAMLPRGSERLDNRWGTAPGFALHAGKCRFAFLPGVPGEMKAMFGHWVQPDLTRRFQLQAMDRVILRTVGVGESALQERLNPIGLPPNIGLGFRAGGAENTVKLLFPQDFPKEERSHWIEKALNALGDAVFATGTGDAPPLDLEAVVGRGLAASSATLFVIETLSGGQVANRCSGLTGFVGAQVSPDLNRLLGWFGVEGQGASERAASQLARRARSFSGASHILVQLGDPLRVRVPENGTSTPMFLALATRDQVIHGHHLISGEGPRRQNSAAALSLDFLRRQLEGLR